MRNIKLVCLTIGLLAMIANVPVLARGSEGGSGGGHGGSSYNHGNSHLNLGISVGGYYGPGFYGYGGYGYPYYYPPYYYPPAYAYPPTVIVPSTPPVYIQREQPQTNYWYHCQDPEGYYPYVKNCPAGWLQVAPQPPAQ